jgi:hypothetical protein
VRVAAHIEFLDGVADHMRVVGPNAVSCLQAIVSNLTKVRRPQGFEQDLFLVSAADIIPSKVDELMHRL